MDERNGPVPYGTDEMDGGLKDQRDVLRRHLVHLVESRASPARAT